MLTAKRCSWPTIFAKAITTPAPSGDILLLSAAAALAASTAECISTKPNRVPSDANSTVTSRTFPKVANASLRVCSEASAGRKSTNTSATARISLHRSDQLHVLPNVLRREGLVHLRCKPIFQFCLLGLFIQRCQPREPVVENDGFSQLFFGNLRRTANFQE